MPRPLIHLLLSGMAPGMLLNLCRGKLQRRVPLLYPPLSLGIHDEQGRRNIDAFPQQCHRTLQGFDGCLEDQDGFAGNEPAGMITQYPRFNTMRGASQPQKTCQCADGRTRKDHHQGSGKFQAGNRLRPVHEKSGNPANSSGQDRSQRCPEGTPPEERVRDLDISTRTLVSKSGASESLLCQFPESSPGVISFREVTNQNANTHYMSFSHYVVWAYGHRDEIHVKGKPKKEPRGPFQGMCREVDGDDRKINGGRNQREELIRLLVCCYSTPSSCLWPEILCFINWRSALNPPAVHIDSFEDMVLPAQKSVRTPG